MNFRSIPNKIGFTKTEFNVLVILFLVFIFGLSLKLYRYYDRSDNAPIYNYSLSDSLFVTSSDQGDNIETTSSSNNNSAEKINVLELDERIFHEKNEKISGNKKIGINSAGIKELIKLPGIGEKTALKILELRKQRGKFQNTEELKDVPGIGNSKFENMKNYIIID